VTKLWGGRFAGGQDPVFESFHRSLPFDRRLWREDLRGSVAWAKALERARVLTAGETREIVGALERITSELEADPAPLERSTAEDVHSFVEGRLAELVGDLAKKLHTGRSRNDQVATDLRLFLIREAAELDGAIGTLMGTLVDLAERTADLPVPGYTHLQRAQPITVGHHALAYVEMLARDRARVADLVARADECPLGSGALAGTAFPVDREALAEDLGFAAPTRNSLDAVSDRDYVVEFLSAAAIVGMHLSRLAGDLTLWATAEFGFVEIADAFATGSSIMPQKKNPDVAELIRGKSGRLYGNLVAVLTIMKGLPLTYNSDMQEDKEPLFDSIDTLEAILRVLPAMLRTLTFREGRMREAAGAHYSTATDLADYLVRKGLPFREAHEVVGKTVRHGIAAGKELGELSLEEFQRFSSLVGPDVHAALTVESSLAARAVLGGTAPEAVKRALAAARAAIAQA